MNTLLIRNIIISCGIMLVGLLPYSATTADVSEEKHNGVKSTLLIAAQNGDMKAQSLYIEQNTQPKTQASKPIIDHAKTWAEAGNVALMLWLANNYYTGNQLPQKFRTAGTWYFEAAKSGNLNANFNLGYMYFHGQGTKQNLKRAQEFLIFSANKNHAPSVNLLKEVNAKIDAQNAHNAKWKAIKEEQHQAQLEVDRLTKEVRISEARLDLSQTQLKLAEAEQKVKEAKFVNTLLAKNNKFKAGAAFKLIENVPLRTDKVMITQYFSYNCKGCNLLQTNGSLDKWLNNKNEDVRFNKTHITGISKSFARLFYTLEKMDVDEGIHKDIFNQISSKHPIYTKDNGFLDFVSRYGIDTKVFNDIYSSAEMDKKIKAHANHEKTLSFKTIPAFVVNGQYYVTPVTAGASKPDISSNLSEDELYRQLALRMFEIIDYLVNLEREVIKNK